MQLAYQIFSSPLGEILVAGTPHAITHVIRGDNRSRMCSEFLYQNNNVAKFGKTRYVQDACEAIMNYLSGNGDISDIAIDTCSNAFEWRLWQALRDVPYGETITYNELALLVGMSGATDELVSTCARNPLPILIPSHRVLKNSDDAGDFIWGGKTKNIPAATRTGKH